MKKLVIFLTVFAILFTLSACDYEYTPSTDESSLGVMAGASSEEDTSLESKTETDSLGTQSEEESTVSSSEPSPTLPSSSVSTSSKPAEKPSDATSTPSEESKPTSSVQQTTPNSVMVWIPTNGGKKYHSKSSCSGMKNPSYVTKDEAINQGFGPCGRCY